MRITCSSNIRYENQGKIASLPLVARNDNTTKIFLTFKKRIEAWGFRGRNLSENSQEATKNNKLRSGGKIGEK